MLPQIHRDIDRRRTEDAAGSDWKGTNSGISNQAFPNTAEAGWNPRKSRVDIQKIQQAYQATSHTICQIAKRFVTSGVNSALGRKEQVNRHKKIDGRVEAHMIAIVCSEAPEGRERWTLQLIADELVRLGIVDSISDTAVMKTLKKKNLSLGKRKNGVSRNRVRNL